VLFFFVVQNDNQQNLSDGSRVKEAIFKYLSNVIRDVMFGFPNNIGPSLKRTLIKGLISLGIFFICLFITKPVLFTFVCQSSISNSPFISDFCAEMPETNGTRIVVPANSFIQGSVTVAERLSNTDVGMTVKITQVKISLLDLQTSVSFSKLDKVEKDELNKKFEEITDLAQSTARGMHKMLANFNSALEELARYAKNLHTHLTQKRSIFSRLLSKPKPVEVAIIPEQFIVGLQTIDSEIEGVMHNTESVNSMLGMYFAY
jgi:hypothetical protein